MSLRGGRGDTTPRLRVAIGLWLAVRLVAGCGNPDAPRADPELATARPPAGCSELARVVYGWADRADDACSAVQASLRELIPLGDGYLLDWTPRTGVHRLWRVGGASPLGVDAIQEGAFKNLRLGYVLVPVGNRRVLIVRPLFTDFTLVSANVNAPQNADILANTIVEGFFDRGFAGRDMVALDEGFLLDFTPGDGAFVVRHIDEPGNQLPTGITATAFHGTQEALRRGARLTNLGGHRLLEWVPVTRHYRIWAYHFRTGETDIFDGAPVAEGDFPDLGPGHELRLVAADRILIWERATGRVVLRAFDPAASNPLGGAVIGDAVYPLLSSVDWTAPTRSSISNVVIVLQRGRSFDSYFGRYCQAPAGSSPACEEGPACCEAMPASIPNASACAVLDPGVDLHVPQETAKCLADKIQKGAMTGFAVPPCGAAGDFACASAGSGLVADTYHAAAARGSLADHFFQSTLDGPEQNLIYLSKTAHGVDLLSESGRHVTRLMAEEGVRWALYLDDRDHTAGQRPPEFYDAHWTHFRSVDELDRDVELQQLPAVSIVIPAVSDSEQPGQGPAQVGLELAHHVWQTVLGAPAYASSTLVLSTFLSSGGYFDHVAPPAAPPLTIDENLGEPVDYGPRVPLLALGPFARVNHISHVPLELSSLTVFLEWNWLRAGSGVLGQRDTTAANLGSLLEPARTGVVVPP